MNLARLVRLTAIALAVASCVEPPSADAPARSSESGSPQPPAVERDPTPPPGARGPDLPEAFRREQEALLAAARRDMQARPGDPLALIWVGRRLGYLERYEEAVALYTRGIERWPELPHLYRHRGHRWITLRRFDLAAADLERAATLIAGRPDEVEPDGLPNERGIPTSTLHSNIWYHLGLARYLQGDFEAAREAYRACLGVSKNPDMLSATTHWLYMTLRRLGRPQEAEELLAPIDAEMDIIENRDYHRLLMMYKGQGKAADIWSEAASAGGVGLATLGYGVGNWYLVQGDRPRAETVLRHVVAQGPSAAFGAIAAEVELRRLETR